MPSQIIKPFKDAAIKFYTEYIYDRFEKIDIKYPEDEYLSEWNSNTGAKGEVIFEPIVDISMWLFGYSLGQDYSIIDHYGENSYTGYEGIDYRIQLKRYTIDIEVKNLQSHYTLSKSQFNDNIVNRYDTNTSIYRALLVQKGQAIKLQKKCNKYGIEIVQISDFMKPWDNDKKIIKDNITDGINNLTKYFNNITGDKILNIDSYSIKECITLGMPQWFIKKYRNRSLNHIKNISTNIGAINRNTKKWKDLELYRKQYI